MSYQAVQWALDDAPMLRTPKGKPDTTARAVLVARAERADEFGCGTHASIADVMWRTGYDERTVQRAQERLEAAGLMVRDGLKFGRPNWNLGMSKRRDQAERAEVDAAIERRKEADRERIRARRQNAAAAVADEARLDSASRRLESPSRHSDSASRRLDAVPPEPPGNLPGTSLEPPTGGAPPPDPLRPEAPTSPRNENHPPSQVQDQNQDPVSNHRPHAREDPPEACPNPGCAKGYVLTGDPPTITRCPQCTPTPDNVIPLFGDRKAQ